MACKIVRLCSLQEIEDPSQYWDCTEGALGLGSICKLECKEDLVIPTEVTTC